MIILYLIIKQSAFNIDDVSRNGLNDYRSIRNVGILSLNAITMDVEAESPTVDKSDTRDIHLEDDLISIESIASDLSKGESYEDKAVLKEDIRAGLPETYAEYSRLFVEEKVEFFAISDNAVSLDVKRLVKKYFHEISYDYSIDEIMDESDEIYDGFRKICISRDVDRICNELQEEGLPYWYLSVSEKAKLFAFRMDNNNYNLALHSAVLKKLGVDMDFDERYEDYQKIYEEGLGLQRNDRVKDRGR